MSSSSTPSSPAVEEDVVLAAAPTPKPQSSVASSSTSETLVVAHNVVHMRAKPESNAEQVSQQLMGRTVRVLKEEGRWVYVEGDDTYRGWSEKRLLVEPRSGQVFTPVTNVFADLRTKPAHNAPLLMRLPVDASVHVEGPVNDTPFLQFQTDAKGQQMAVNERWLLVSLPDGTTKGWVTASTLGRREAMPLTAFRGRRTKISAEDGAKIPVTAVVVARNFLGTPYLWGGSSSFGLDCSGLMQLCYRLAGMTLRRDADIQRTDERFVPVEVKDVAKAGEDLKPGDLVFFGKPDKITHVGMHYSGNTFIHSAGGVGVVITEWGDDRYSPRFVDARRLNPERAGEPVVRFEAENR